MAFYNLSAALTANFVIRGMSTRITGCTESSLHEGQMICSAFILRILIANCDALQQYYDDDDTMTRYT